MSYSSPDYAKKKGGSGSGQSPSEFTAAVVTVVKDNLGVVYWEPMMASAELVLSTEGDLMMGYAGIFDIVDN